MKYILKVATSAILALKSGVAASAATSEMKEAKSFSVDIQRVPKAQESHKLLQSEQGERKTRVFSNRLE